MPENTPFDGTSLDSALNLSKRRRDMGDSHAVAASLRATLVMDSNGDDGPGSDDLGD